MAAPAAGKLTSICALYRNDHDDGLGVRFTSTTSPTVEAVHAFIVEAMPFLPGRLAESDMRRTTVAELRRLAKLFKHGEPTAEDTFAAVLNIVFLLEAGIIAEGEHNGIVFVYAAPGAGQPDGTVH